MESSQVLKARIFGDGMIDRDSRFSKIKINHIPIMITDSGKILCIPQSKEMTHIGLSAMTGKGKGIGGTSLLSMEFWHSKRMCMILNDFQNETHENSLPCLNKTFNQNLRAINTSPISLPAVYVYPSCRDLVIDDTQSLFPHLVMSLPTELVIRNIEYFYELGKAAKYITGYKERFESCGDVEQIKEILEEILPSDGGNRNSFEEMKFKILTIFKNVFDEKLTNSSTPESPDRLSIICKGEEVYSGPTILALIAAGLVPSIQTSEIRGKPWFSPYMSFIVEAIYMAMQKEEFFKDKNLTMYVPEIDKMWKGENADGGSKIKEKLSLIGTNGRRAGIRMIWDAQDYDAVPDAIRSNTKTLLVGRKANAEEVRGIKKDFNISKEFEGIILSLESSPEKGRFEFVALTADRFALYDLKDGALTFSSEPQRGTLITPLCQSKQPGRPLASVIKNE